MRRALLIILFISGYFISIAQVKTSYAWTTLVEQWCIQNKIDTEEMFENLNELYENPININDTNQLTNLFILDPFQQKALKSYIMQYGELLSIQELHLINYFDSTTIKILEPITYTAPIDNNKLSFEKILKYGNHNFVIGTNSNIESARGYNENIYDGSPLRFYYRYYFKYKNRIQLMCSGEKDPGESIFTKNQPRGFDFYGYHLLLNNIGPLKRTIIGQYYLQFGQGLTLWTGFNPYSTTNIYRSVQGIRPAGVFTEYGYLNGIATTASIKKFDITLFYSNVDRNGTSNGNEDSIQSLYKSGYHRTDTELKKKHMINEQLWGTNIQYNRYNFHLGTTLQQIYFSKKIEPKETPYNIYAFHGNRNMNWGIDASYLWTRLLLFGEFSIAQNKGTAGLIGIQIPLKNNSKLSASYRNFSMKYQNLYATSIGQNSQPQNERGLYISLTTTLPKFISVQLSADFFKFPWLKYKVYSPTYGAEYRIQLDRDFRSKYHLGMTYNFKEQGYNQMGNIYTYSIYEKKRHNLQIFFRYQTKSWNFTSRIINTWSKKEYTETSHGIFISQDIQYTPQITNLTLGGRIAIFNAPNHDARLYTVENNLQYEFNMNSFMNKGLRFYLVLHYNINRIFSINAKYGLTYYTDLETIGNGYNKINLNHLQNVKIQLRLKF